MKRLLRWFWVPIRESENWAQTLVRVLGNLFRTALTLAIALAATIATSIYVDGSDGRERERQARLISVEAQTGISNGCTAEFPLAIRVRNNSTLALTSMDINLSARLPGTSTNVLPYGERTIRWDHIVPPQHVLGMCYRGGREPVDASRVYSASAVSYAIELQPAEDWMFRETLARRMNRFDRYVADSPPCRDGASECEPWERDWDGESADAAAGGEPSPGPEGNPFGRHLAPPEGGEQSAEAPAAEGPP